MAGLAFQKYWRFVEDLAEGKHALATDNIHGFLTVRAPLGADMTLGDAQVINANWNDAALEGQSLTRAGGVLTFGGTRLAITVGLVADDATVRALGLYNGSNNLLIGYWDLGATMPLRSDATIWFGKDGPFTVFQLQ